MRAKLGKTNNEQNCQKESNSRPNLVKVSKALSKKAEHFYMHFHVKLFKSSQLAA